MFAKWLDVVPSLMEGIGHVAAYESISEAMSMLEQPSESTPEAALGGAFASELVLLWVSEAAASASSLVTHPLRARVQGNVRAWAPARMCTL